MSMYVDGIELTDAERVRTVLGLEREYLEEYPQVDGLVLRHGIWMTRESAAYVEEEQAA